jgi:hypothetical protein
MNVTERDMSDLIDHIGLVMRTVNGLHSAHERLHKVHDQLYEAHKVHSAAHAKAVASGQLIAGDTLDQAHIAHRTAHERARLQRLEHKTDHGRHMQACAKLAGTLKKILGGGPESIEPTGDPTKLPSRLDTAHKREACLFDTLAKNSKSAPRFFKNAHNPHWTG